jgi:hypothetical protein
MLLLILLALVTSVMILLVLILSDSKRNIKLLEQVSEEGYETALEILSPDHKFIFRKNSCGPVLAD